MSLSIAWKFFNSKDVIVHCKLNFKMVEAVKNANRKCLVKHFPIDEQNSFVQYTVTVPEEEYNEMVGAGALLINPGKNKILVQALDVSGSMAGAPIDALKIGA